MFTHFDDNVQLQTQANIPIEYNSALLNAYIIQPSNNKLKHPYLMTKNLQQLVDSSNTNSTKLRSIVFAIHIR